MANNTKKEMNAASLTCLVEVAVEALREQGDTSLLFFASSLG